MIAGSASGMFNAYRNGGKDAKSFGDMKKAASAGARVSFDNKGKREAYRAAHGDTLRGAMAGHARDMAFSAKEWATGQKLGVLTAAEQHRYDVLTDFEGRVKAYEGLWKNEKAWIDADANARNARVQSAVAKQNFDAFNSGATSRFYDKINQIASTNTGMKTDDIFKKAYDSLVQEGIDATTRATIMNSQKNMKQAYNAMNNAAIAADQAQKILDATTADIQKKKEKAMGSIEAQINMFRDAHVYSKEDCKTCWNKFYCSGGCHANAINFNNDIRKPYELGCEMQKKRTECSIMIQAKLMLEGE